MSSDSMNDEDDSTAVDVGLVIFVGFTGACNFSWDFRDLDFPDCASCCFVRRCLTYNDKTKDYYELGFWDHLLLLWTIYFHDNKLNVSKHIGFLRFKELSVFIKVYYYCVSLLFGCAMNKSLQEISHIHRK